MFSRFSWWRLQAGCAALLIASCVPGPAPTPSATPPAPEPPARVEPPPPCRRIAKLEIRKSERRLLAHCEGGRVSELSVSLGRDPIGPKRRAGDSRTPEGRYRISARPQPSRFHLFIPIDYPSLEDAEAARAEGLLSREDHQRILAAHARGEEPPADTPLGGRLGLHGEGERWRGDSPHLDWTYGCVALSDSDIDFLARRTRVGTPVVIRP
jgi:murein L,D-transpeptidase YafK